MLAARWTEQYQNPYSKRFGGTASLGSSYDGFTQPESVFNVYSASEADYFFGALQVWDDALRTTERKGGELQVTPYYVSLRKDILGFSDVRYDTNLERFVTDYAAMTNNIRRFQALMLQNSHPEGSTFWLTLQFPLAYNQYLKSVSGGKRQPLVIPVSQNDWNLRLTSIQAKLDGVNIAQAENGLYRIQLYQYGKISNAQYFPRNTINKALFSINLPLYDSDPTQGSTSAYSYSLEVPVVVGGPGSGYGPALDVTDVEPSPFCDRYILAIEQSANHYRPNLQNIEDILFIFNVRGGIPASSTGFTW